LSNDRATDSAVRPLKYDAGNDRMRPAKFLVIPPGLILRTSMRSGTASFLSTAARVLSAWIGIGRLRRPQPLQFLPRRSRLLVAAGVLLLGINCGWVTVAQAATPAPDDKWRIVCMHHALSDGVIVFRLTPVRGEAIELKVPIKKGTYENDVARQVRDVLSINLPKMFYHVETDDGEAVLVKKQRGKSDFSLEFVSNSVNGLGIRVELD
jgi:hypothetical protein